MLDNGHPVAVSGAADAPAMHVRFEGAAIVGYGPTLIFERSHDSRLRAIDQQTGRERWSVPVVRADEVAVTATESVAFIEAGGDVVARSTIDGRLLRRLHGYIFDAVLNGTLYATQGKTLVAFRDDDLRILWKTTQQSGVAGAPFTQIGDTLFVNITLHSEPMQQYLMALDVRTGHARFQAGYGDAPLGSSGGLVMLSNAEMNPDDSLYQPLPVSFYRLSDGGLDRDDTYAPDAPRHTQTFGRPTSRAFFAGDDVYLKVDADWYRYTTHAPANSVTPQRFEKISELYPVGTNVLVATTKTGASVLRLFPDRIERDPIGLGAVGGTPVPDIDGGLILVLGSRLVRVDTRGNVFLEGRVACAQPDGMRVFPKNIVVHCAGRHADLALYRRHGSVPVPVAMQTAAPQSNLPFSVEFTSVDRREFLASPENGFKASIALEADSSAVVAASINGAPATVTHVSSHEIDSIALAPELRPVPPFTLIVDNTKTLWYVDTTGIVVHSYDKSGTVRSFPIGTPASPPPLPPPGIQMGPPTVYLPIRIALDRAGHTWYARSLPSPQIGRVLNRLHFDVPKQFGNVIALIGGDDGALWFLTPDSVGRMTPDGRFARIPLPAELHTTRLNNTPQLVAGRDGHVWVMFRSLIVLIDSLRIVRTFRLPNFNDVAESGVTACDGALLVGHSGPQVTRIDERGAENYETPGRSGYSALARGGDCRIWYAIDDAADNRHIGTLKFVPARRHQLPR